MNMKRFLALVLGLMLVLSAFGAVAELDFPKDTIKLIVPFDAGGGNDIYGRVFAQVAVEDGYFNGQQVVVDNMPGGGGAIGQAYLVNSAAPDGYTLLTFTASGITNPILKDVPFTTSDFRIIVCANSDPVVLVARPDAPFDDIAGMIEYAKDHVMICNDSGFGTNSHIRTLDWTSKMEDQYGVKIDFECIHCDSGAIQVSELMGGHADLACLTVGECADYILEGQVKGLAIMDTKRFESLPDVPTFLELGYENFIDGADRALCCSSKVPDDIYEYLVEECTKLVSSEHFINLMKEKNLNPACKSAEEYQKYIDMKTELITSLKDYLLTGNK